MIFAGILNRSKNPREICDFANKIIENISRTPEDIPEQRNVGNLTLITTNPGLSRELLSISNTANGITLVSGHPYFCHDLKSLTLEEQTEHLGNQLSNGTLDQLRSSRGSFCGLSYVTETETLSLFTDKVGIFPIYYYKNKDYLFFSSALRIIFAIFGKELIPNIESTTEILALGYPLGDSTHYQDVRSIRGGTILSFDKFKLTELKYWRWDEVKSNNLDESSISTILYEQFLESISLRKSTNGSEISFLSGGLDSRCVAAALKNIGKEVHSLNFAPEGSQDFVFGRMASSALGTLHFERQLNAGNFSLRQKQIITEFCLSFADTHPELIKQPRVWSGDGGSVGLGHVYLDHTFINLLRTSKFEDSVNYFFKKHKISIPLKATKSTVNNFYLHKIKNRVLDEIIRYSPSDLARQGFFFLLENDQRRHLSAYFENIDILRYELILPFFDANFLETIISSNIDYFLNHDFYNSWLYQFGESTYSVPWQAYPGHTPCPIRSPNLENLRYQWAEGWFDDKEALSMRRNRILSISKGIVSNKFPSFIFSRSAVFIALLFDTLNIKDFSYIFDAVDKTSELFN